MMLTWLKRVLGRCLAFSKMLSRSCWDHRLSLRGRGLSMMSSVIAPSLTANLTSSLLTGTLMSLNRAPALFLSAFFLIIPEVTLGGASGSP